nr:MAG TPA: hypothetical protein [Caudoviricetes sp.]
MLPVFGHKNTPSNHHQGGIFFEPKQTKETRNVTSLLACTSILPYIGAYRFIMQE